MTRKVFTDEEIEMIRQNPHTRSVTPKTIKFTQEFKDLFLERVPERHHVQSNF